MDFHIYQRPDLHMHSTYSDGSDTPELLIQNVKKAGIDLFALTDHDTYDGCAKVKELLQPGDPDFLSGVEISCQCELGKFHILGYCYDVRKDPIRSAVKLVHTARIEKTYNRFDYLESLGYTFTEEDKITMLARENPGRPHFAALLLEKGYVQEKADGFKIMEGYHGKEKKLRPEEAIDAILHSDGIPVLAHGILADGSKNLTAEEIEERVQYLKSFGLMGLECFYSTFTPEQKQIMLDLAEKYDLMVTAGSDYHGKNKTVQLGQTNDPDPKRMERFYKAVELIMR